VRGSGTIIALVLALGWRPALPAEELEDDALALQPVVVTGSRIARPDFDSASPVVTLGSEAFEQTGAPTVETTLNLLPQFVPNFSSASNNPSADGQAHLDLRGLGPHATLVLLDGRRLTPSNGAGAVDVNLIPPTLIERVEIVSGGASAVYGSDAVAGVVNFRLKESFEGFELGGFYGAADRGDGEQWDANFTAGTSFAGGRGTAYGFVGHAERRLVTQGDRKYSRHALFHVGAGNGTLGPGNGFLALGSGFIEDGYAILPTSGANPIDPDAFRVLFDGYGAPASLPFQPLFGFNQDGTLFTRGLFQPGMVANYRGFQDPLLFNDSAVTYNFAPPNALQLPLQRTSAFGRLAFDLSDTTRLYADGLYADYHADRQLAPAPLLAARMPRSNPFIPADLAFLLDSRPAPDEDFQWTKRLSELGPRVARDDYDVYQGTIGLDGYLSGDWRYDTYLQYGEVRQTNRQSGNALNSRIEALTFAADGGLAACGGFDIFGLGSISAECAALIAVDGDNEVSVRQVLAEVSIEGPVLELPAGDLRAAFGVFHKRERFSYTADPLASTILPDGRVDIVGFNASDDVRGRERNTDLYVEALVPLLAHAPGAWALDAGLGYRHSEYDAAGGVDAFKFELLYRPIEALRLRGSFQNAVRAPSIIELFEPQLPTFFFPNPGDPCAAGSPARTGPDAAAVEALCLAQGVPAALLPAFEPTFGNVVFGFGGGNPELEPEKAETWTVGLAWSPTRDHPRFGRLQASIDAYRIEIEDAIEQVVGEEIIALCFDPQVNPDFSPEQTWCGFLSRHPVSGELVDLFAIQRNLGRIRTRGIDLQLDWRLPAGPGTFGFNFLVSWLDSFERNPGGGAPTTELAGLTITFPGTSLPEWKSLLGLNYAWKGYSITARTRYIGRMHSFWAPEFEVPSRTYVDLFASHDFGAGALDGLRLGLGIENLTDRDPPILAGSQAANTDPQQFDTLGRRYFLRLSYRF
jgi:outer membrane receptor protein involved in Fe transport